MESTETRILRQLEQLGENATTANIVEFTGHAKGTVIKTAERHGYEIKRYGGPWVKKDDRTSNDVQSEVVEALHLIREALQELSIPTAQPVVESKNDVWHVRKTAATSQTTVGVKANKYKEDPTEEGFLELIELYANLMYSLLDTNS